MKKIRFGIIGTSTITVKFLEGASLEKRFEFSAVYSRSLNKAEEFVKALQFFNKVKTFDSLEEMLSSNLIDALYIASPNSLHCDQTLMALKHKKHVLCEKAFASNIKEVERMINASKENGVVLMEAMKTLSMPNFKVVKENLFKIGTVHKYFSSYCQYSSRYDSFKKGIIENAFKKELSNGALMDIGVYTIAPMVELWGIPCDMKAAGKLLPTGVDSDDAIISTYENMIGTMIYSKVNNSHLATEIEGEDGVIIIERINLMDSVKIRYRNGKEETLSVEQQEKDMYYEIKAFIDTILNDDKISLNISHQTSLATMQVMDAVKKEIGYD